MARLANIVRRAGTYHFRRVVPPHLRERLRRRELVRSLQTNLPSAAKLKADLLYRASERLFVAASFMLSQDLLARLVQDFYNLVIEIEDHRRLLASGPIRHTSLDRLQIGRSALGAGHAHHQGRTLLASTHRGVLRDAPGGNLPAPCRGRLRS